MIPNFWPVEMGNSSCSLFFTHFSQSLVCFRVSVFTVLFFNEDAEWETHTYANQACWVYLCRKYMPLTCWSWNMDVSPQTSFASHTSWMCFKWDIIGSASLGGGAYDIKSCSWNSSVHKGGLFQVAFYTN